MTNFVQLEIAEYERLKAFEDLVDKNTVFTKYYSHDGTSYSTDFNCPVELRNMTGELDSLKRETRQELYEKDNVIRSLQHEIHVLQNRTLWQRIINKTVC